MAKNWIFKQPLLNCALLIAFSSDNLLVITLVDGKALGTRLAIGQLDRLGRHCRVQTQTSRDQIVRLRVLEDLVAALAMARSGAALATTLPVHCVQTQVKLFILHGANVVEIFWQGRLWINVVQVPLERLALEPLSQLDPWTQIASVYQVQVRHNLVKVLGVLVCPDVDKAPVVLENDAISSAWKSVRRLLSEHVTHVTARRNEQLAAAHPNPERHLQVLGAPHVHAVVVGADVVEKLALYGKQAAGHGGGAQGSRVVVLAPLVLALGNGHPIEHKVRVKATIGHLGAGQVLEGLVRDHIYDRTGHRAPVPLHLGQQRLQPAPGCFDVRVQKGHGGARGRLCSSQPRSHQAHALRIAQDFHLDRQTLGKCVQCLVQVVAALARVVH
ncbi:hypothetical protein BpHYR1_021112 [Brachionus plicatilis]|uniref:Uncharacterized protein n=1 Tax=Brachionus plicatilis TaxID=10195 RepID=A0A3M7SDT3_BRAPC|nr:hypothetical protein BpHYR1_021112 [Brachionus plicatilis]